MFKKLLLVLSLIQVSYAGDITASQQVPYNIHIFPQNGMFVFYANITDGDLPSCNGDHRWSINTDKPGAQELISMVIAARTAGNVITVKGTGDCNPDGYGYQVNYLFYDQ